MAARREAPIAWLGLWERAIASGFHVYSSGVIALALGRDAGPGGRARSYVPITIVVVLHAATDFLAANGRLVTESIYVLESIFTLAALLTWLLFI
jgi:hypothetical protein